MNESLTLRLARGAWLALIAWQFAWLALLPEPLGKGSLGFALLVTAPLLVPLRGIIALRPRSLIWGGYLALFAGMLGIMELWAAPAERPATGLQLLLCVLYLVFLAVGTRRRRD